MANITLNVNGVLTNYTDVNSLTVPQTGGGEVTFYANGGGANASYLINDDDTVSALYFNLIDESTMNAILASLTYDQVDSTTGLEWCYIGFDYLCAADLSSVGLGSGYILYWGEDVSNPLNIIYSSITFDASAIISGLVISKAGWQKSSVVFDNSVTANLSELPDGIAAIMNSFLAKSPMGFGVKTATATINQNNIEFSEQSPSTAAMLANLVCSATVELPADATIVNVRTISGLKGLAGNTQNPYMVNGQPTLDDSDTVVVTVTETLSNKVVSVVFDPSDSTIISAFFAAGMNAGSLGSSLVVVVTYY